MLLETESPASSKTSTDSHLYTTRQLMKLAEVLERNGISAEHFDRVLASGLLEDVFDPSAAVANRKGVRAALNLGAMQQKNHVSVPACADVTVTGSLTLEQMIAAGNYEWINGDINAQQFSIESREETEYETRLFHFSGLISTENVLTKIQEADKSNPWRAACIEHLLAYGAKFPDEQRKHPIVALGSATHATFFGRRNVPYLYRRVIGRSLHLEWRDNQWQPVYRFLAVRELF